ncbi:MAG: hypothetical protein SO314_00305 [Alphaproteobacteria bacterium]|nr:hypothetical protein [Alphaproteobacteria bacterium]
MGKVWQSDFLSNAAELEKTIKKRGNLALVSSYTSKDGSVFSAKKRYIWPNSYAESSSRRVTKRIWGRDL